MSPILHHIAPNTINLLITGKTKYDSFSVMFLCDTIASDLDAIFLIPLYFP